VGGLKNTPRCRAPQVLILRSPQGAPHKEEKNNLSRFPPKKTRCFGRPTRGVFSSFGDTHPETFLRGYTKHLAVYPSRPRVYETPRSFLSGQILPVNKPSWNPVKTVTPVSPRVIFSPSSGGKNKFPTGPNKAQESTDASTEIEDVVQRFSRRNMIKLNLVYHHRFRLIFPDALQSNNIPLSSNRYPDRSRVLLILINFTWI